uniref:ATP synthase F0 subunit 8 n=1 Tax=Provanna clathrata TaxID=1940160 RepID=UPI00286B32E0|nr:ATP synthase F0 subunit 8 [Provanna clathrata]WKW52619.1 ATP synthase F0 subunit 8 [Provanna clathrata]
MPQLSPLNWIFLFLLFWLAVLTISVLIWWSSNTFFKPEHLEESKTQENKWNW